jgi:hypothetical protein
LGLQGGLAFAQLGGAGAELFEGEQLFLVAIDQASQRVLRAREVPLDRVTTRGGRVRGAESRKPAVDLGLDQCRVVEQSEDPRPDELVDLCQADRPVLADAAFGTAVPVGARAAVVLAQDPVWAARRAAVVGIAAFAADEDPLQERRAPGIPWRQALLAVQTVLNERELFFGHERGHGDLLPLISAHALTRYPCGALPALTRVACLADRRAGRVRLAVGGLPGVGRVAEHPPNRRVVPARLASPGRDALL